MKKLQSLIFGAAITLLAGTPMLGGTMEPDGATTSDQQVRLAQAPLKKAVTKEEQEKEAESEEQNPLTSRVLNPLPASTESEEKPETDKAIASDKKVFRVSPQPSTTEAIPQQRPVKGRVLKTPVAPQADTAQERVRQATPALMGAKSVQEEQEQYSDRLVALATQLNNLHSQANREANQRGQVSDATAQRLLDKSVELLNAYYFDVTALRFDYVLNDIRRANRTAQYDQAVRLQQAMMFFQQRLTRSDSELYRRGLAAYIEKNGLRSIESLVIAAIDRELRFGGNEVIRAAKSAYLRNPNDLDTNAPVILLDHENMQFLALPGSSLRHLLEATMILDRIAGELTEVGVMGLAAVGGCLESATESVASGGRLPGVAPTGSGGLAVEPGIDAGPSDLDLVRAGSSTGYPDVDSLIESVCGGMGGDDGSLAGYGGGLLLSGDCDYGMSVIGRDCSAAVAEAGFTDWVMGDDSNDDGYRGPDRSWIATEGDDAPAHDPEDVEPDEDPATTSSDPPAPPEPSAEVVDGDEIIDVGAKVEALIVDAFDTFGFVPAAGRVLGVGNIVLFVGSFLDTSTRSIDETVEHADLEHEQGSSWETGRQAGFDGKPMPTRTGNSIYDNFMRLGYEKGLSERRRNQGSPVMPGEGGWQGHSATMECYSAIFQEERQAGHLPGEGAWDPSPDDVQGGGTTISSCGSSDWFNFARDARPDQPVPGGTSGTGIRRSIATRAEFFERFKEAICKHIRSEDDGYCGIVDKKDSPAPQPSPAPSQRDN